MNAREVAAVLEEIEVLQQPPAFAVIR